MGFFKKRVVSDSSSLKQVIAVRSDLKLPKGKLAAQVAHASVEAVFNSSSLVVDSWRASGMKKVVVKVADEKDLISLINSAKREGLVASLITDAGKTVVAPGTKTALGIGPDKEEIIDRVTSGLQLM